MASWRVRIVDEAGVTRPGGKGPYIFGVWHNRLGISMLAWNRIVRAQPDERLGALISASRDGGLLAATLAKFKVQPIRGSSSRRGSQAMLELTTWIKGGGSVAITPDGPRGPKYEVREGIIALAQLTGAPIIPVRARIYSKSETKSWDQFQIPLPFTRIDLYFDPPMPIPPDADREQMAADLNKRLLVEMP